MLVGGGGQLLVERISKSCLFQKCKQEVILVNILYFFSYKTTFFSTQNNPKDLDPSCKMDLDLWDCLGSVKLVL